MNSTIKLDKNQLHIFHEIRKRRIFVGTLIYHKEENQYELIYDQNYANSKNAIPLGPNLSLFKTHHISPKGKLFPSFLDRIPSRENPAYEDYCYSQGISVNEKNYIILLGSIGKRGPSSFVFENVYINPFSSKDIIALRENLNITQHDLAEAFGISKITLQRIESGTSKDPNTLKLLQIYFEHSEVALEQLKLTGSRVHIRVLSKLQKYFKDKISV